MQCAADHESGPMLRGWLGSRGGHRPDKIGRISVEICPHFSVTKSPQETQPSIKPASRRKIRRRNRSNRSLSQTEESHESSHNLAAFAEGSVLSVMPLPVLFTRSNKRSPWAPPPKRTFPRWIDPGPNTQPEASRPKDLAAADDIHNKECTDDSKENTDVAEKDSSEYASCPSLQPQTSSQIFEPAAKSTGPVDTFANGDRGMDAITTANVTAIATGTETAVVKPRLKKVVTWSGQVDTREIERTPRHEVFSVDLLVTDIALELAKVCRSQSMAAAVLALLKYRQSAADSIRHHSASAGWTGCIDGWDEVARGSARKEANLLENMDEQARYVVPWTTEAWLGGGQQDSARVWVLKESYREARRMMEDDGCSQRF